MRSRQWRRHHARSRPSFVRSRPSDGHPASRTYPMGPLRPVRRLRSVTGGIRGRGRRLMVREPSLPVLGAMTLAGDVFAAPNPRPGRPDAAAVRRLRTQGRAHLRGAPIRRLRRIRLRPLVRRHPKRPRGRRRPKRFRAAAGSAWLDDRPRLALPAAKPHRHTVGRWHRRFPSRLPTRPRSPIKPQPTMERSLRERRSWPRVTPARDRHRARPPRASRRPPLRRQNRLQSGFRLATHSCSTR